MQNALIRWGNVICLPAAGFCILLALSVSANEVVPAPTAVELGIMQGRPVPRANRVTLANWMTPPFNRWSLQHVAEILPTATIYRGDGPIVELPARKHDVATLRFEAATGEMLSVAQWLSMSYTDGFIVMQNGQVIFEAYLNNMQPRTAHLTYSISKSVIGVLAGVLVDAGELDPALHVEEYVPELQHSGFAGYTVRELLDMLAAIDWNEDYVDSNSQWRQWKESIGWTPLSGNASDLPEGNYHFLPTLARDLDWPGGFRYVSPSAEVMGWVLERAAHKPLAELLSQKLWVPLGAERDAFIATDRSFAPAAAGGIGTTLRDLARFGQMVLNEGTFNGRSIVSKQWITDIRFNGDNAAWRTGQYRGYWNPNGAYRSFWYVAGDTDGSFDAIGIHGQRLHINPAQDLVVVRLSSTPTAVSRDDYDLSSRVIAAISSSLQP
jgi:CubicO group peptidase (beta-lactamase class C family)